LTRSSGIGSARTLLRKLADHPVAVIGGLLESLDILLRTGSLTHPERRTKALAILGRQLARGGLRSEELLRVLDLDEQYRIHLALASGGRWSTEYARSLCQRLPWRPPLSFVLPCRDAGWLPGVLKSMADQVYPSWEAIVCPVAIEGLSTGHADARVRALAPSATVGGALGAALAEARGGWLAILDGPCVLAAEAGFELVRAVQTERETDLVYTDEDVLGADGRRGDPFLKPDWSPELLLSLPYTGRLAFFRTQRLRELGGFAEELDVAAEHDAVLRLAEVGARVTHVPRVLYSALGSGPVKDVAPALARALARRKTPAMVAPATRPGAWRVRYELCERPSVSIVIATAGSKQLYQQCIESILARSTYPDLQIVVVDDSTTGDVAAYCEALCTRTRRVHRRDSGFRGQPFNYPAIHNRAIRSIDAPLIVLLNDDTSVIEPAWIEAMIEHAQRPQIGVVGAKLLYADSSIQHAGVVGSLSGGSFGHAYKGMPDAWTHRTALVDVVHECSAVTFACAMVRRELYLELGGLDEVRLPVAYNDADFCLRAAEHGYRVLYTPHARLHHYESATRTIHAAPGEQDYVRRRWGLVLARDPYYPPAMRRSSEEFSFLGEDLGGRSNR